MFKKLLLSGALALSLGAENIHDAKKVDLSKFTVHEGLEITEWATSPMLYNPTNMDIDYKGRIWVAEGRNYRRKRGSENGDRIVVLEDKDGDGKAESSHTFVQDKELQAPLGVAVVGNKIIVSQPPHLIVYTDVNGDAKFDPEVDKRENFLSGFSGRNHDHSLHSLTVGPNGQYYFNVGNAGAFNGLTDKDGFQLTTGSFYKGKEWSGKKSSDGFVYVGGMAMRINPDGTGLRPIGHNFRNSMEQTVTSFGDVFQNDNDDPPACRTTFLIEYGDLGYASRNGKGKYSETTKKGMPKQIAEWSQDYPGYIPAGDVYGGGSPTGIVFYENGPMEDICKGMLLSCEPARNVVFGYRPEAEGAGYKLERFNFLTTNTSNKFEGADFSRKTTKEDKFLFRPSDVTIGPDGAIYVADWYDQRVGGHATFDPHQSGNIYRIAPKGKTLKTPKVDLDSVAGLVDALKSPAVNVRGYAFIKLKEKGAAVVPQVKALLNDKNKYIAARAIWLLAQLGAEGINTVESYLDSKDVMFKITAFRALRFVESNMLKHAQKLAMDPSAAVRREIAVAMRYVPFAQAKDILQELAKSYDGKDRSYLESWGIGADNKKDEVYKYLQSKISSKSQLYPFAWRLHTDAALILLKERAMDKSLTNKQREHAIDAIAFNETYNGCKTMEDLSKEAVSPENKSIASWWLKIGYRRSWSSFGKVKTELTSDLLIPKIPTNKAQTPVIADIAKLAPNTKNGRAKIAACFMCHKLGANGLDFGPDLTEWGQGQPLDVIITSLVDPNRDVAHGFDAYEVKSKSGKTVQGFLLSDDKYVVLKTVSGSVALLREDVKSMKKIDGSVMIPAQNLGLSNQDIRDISELLKRYKYDSRRKKESF